MVYIYIFLFFLLGTIFMLLSMIKFGKKLDCEISYEMSEIIFYDGRHGYSAYYGQERHMRFIYSPMISIYPVYFFWLLHKSVFGSGWYLIVPIAIGLAILFLNPIFLIAAVIWYIFSSITTTIAFGETVVFGIFAMIFPLIAIGLILLMISQFTTFEHTTMLFLRIYGVQIIFIPFLRCVPFAWGKCEYKGYVDWFGVLANKIYK